MKERLMDIGRAKMLETRYLDAEKKPTTYGRATYVVNEVFRVDGCSLKRIEQKIKREK